MKLSVGFIVCLITIFVLPHKVFAQTTISLDPTANYQTITAWEATSQSGQESNPYFNLYKDKLFDLAVNELGITRLRVEIISGAENQIDWWTEYNNGAIEYDLRDNLGNRICPTDSNGTPMPTPYYRYVRNSTVDDNDTMSFPGIPSNTSGRDPDTTNLNGFQYKQIDHNMDQVVLPFKQYTEDGGGILQVNLEYVSFHRQICAPYTYNVHNNEVEYAEFMVTTVKHLQQKYGITPNVIEPILEPDNTNYFNGTYIAKIIVETHKKLLVEGISGIKFIAPSNTNMSNAINYYDAMVTELNHQGYETSELIEELVYHRYGGVSDVNLQTIAGRGARDGINTAMLERIGSGYEDLHKDLKLANNSSWQQYTLAFGYDPDGRSSYFSVPDASHPSAPVELTNRSKYLRQYFKFIRPGALRIGATVPGCDSTTSCSGAVDPLAFVNADGRYAIVVKTTSNTSFSLVNLPSGTYGITHTIGTSTNQWGVEQNDIVVTDNQSDVISIPGGGIITIYQKTAIGGSVTNIPSATATLTPTPIPLLGDANSDGQVDGIDYVIWLNNYNTDTSLGNSAGDFTNDGFVDGIDYVVWLNNYDG